MCDDVHACMLSVRWMERDEDPTICSSHPSLSIIHHHHQQTQQQQQQQQQRTASITYTSEIPETTEEQFSHHLTSESKSCKKVVGDVGSSLQTQSKQDTR